MSEYDFAFKPFEAMTPEDYARVGFKSGLEIHQQLLTAKKLFCRCPAGRYSPKYDAEILRHMRPTLSELGEYDGTALMEFKTKKEIIYRINRDTVCTYEMDDTPPFMMDEEALDIALGTAMLYNCVMVDELHIARKQYLDGSIPTGFQRTTIVGVSGYVPYKSRKIRIVQLGLEEDACREVSDVGHRRTYLTDRLGMPLIETVTGPDMKTPQEVAEVGQLLRRIVRSTGRVRTGMGAAREDVNVSVAGGTRVEIKGVPRIPRIPLLTHNEAMRQWNLLRLREELGRRGITTESFGAEFAEITKVLRRTAYLPIRSALDAGLSVYGVRLCGFWGLLLWQTQTNTVFSQEISDRVRVIACLTTLPNIIHSDSPGETLASSEWLSVKKALNARDEDTLVLVWGPAEDVLTGAKEIVIRAKEATIGVPSETRQALADGTNGFERILPGPDRMYPDTDLPPKRVNAERLEKIRAGLPPRIADREIRYKELGVPTDLRSALAVSPWAELFETLVGKEGIAAPLTAVVLVQYPKRLCKKGLAADRLNEEVFRAAFMALKERRLSKDGIYTLLEHALADGKMVAELLPPAFDKAAFDKRLAGIGADLKGRRFADTESRWRFVMGLIMKDWRGRIEGPTASAAVRQCLERVKA
ncbi:MAG: Glu-tRNA(Gln) amidotransferase subunit GatE [Candidatus Aminicenantes bacterium]|nr:Glu-tRNA(Gln) amidotransferase subunit GatE [Candidatus Aminicenantes bacterium]